MRHQFDLQQAMENLARTAIGPRADLLQNTGQAFLDVTAVLWERRPRRDGLGFCL